MRSLLLSIAGLLFVVNISVAQDQKEAPELSEPVETGENYEVYGSEFPDKVTFFAPGYLVRNANVFNGQQVATQGKIKQVCQKKGCFFMLQAGDKNIRVTFKDYSFFIPRNSSGSKVQLVGNFRTKDLSEKQAKHYAKDAGGDANKVMGPPKEYNIIATSVKIFDAE